MEIVGSKGELVVGGIDCIDDGTVVGISVGHVEGTLEGVIEGTTVDGIVEGIVDGKWAITMEKGSMEGSR